MNPIAYRNLMMGQALCTLYFGLMLVAAELEGAGVQSLYLALLTASALCGVGLILAWRRRPRLGTAMGLAPVALLALLLVGANVMRHGLAG